MEELQRLGPHLATRIEEIVAAAPGNVRLRAAAAEVYALLGDELARERHVAAPAGDDGSTHAATHAVLSDEWRERRKDLPRDEPDRPEWAARMHEIGVGIAVSEGRARQHAAKDDIAMLTTVASVLRSHPVLLERATRPQESPNLWRFLRDHALAQLVDAAGEGDTTWARQAVRTWADTFEQTVPGSVELDDVWWSPDDDAAVTTALEVSAAAGPGTLAAALHGLSQITFPPGEHAAQLVSSTLTSIVHTHIAAGTGPDWWFEPVATATFAMLGDTFANNEPAHPDDAWPLLLASDAISGKEGWPAHVGSPAEPWAVPFDRVLLTDDRLDDVRVDAERLIGFVQRVDGIAATGVTWWPRPGTTMPEPTDAEAALLPVIAELAGVAIVDPGEVSKFCPPVLIPGAGFGPISIVDPARLDEVAAITGAEVRAVSGLLSADGVQVIVRIGPGAALAIIPSPGLIVLEDPQIGTDERN